MFDRSRQAHLKFPVLSWLATIFSIFAMIVAFKNRHGVGFRNSDYLWTNVLFDDLFLHGGRLADWNLSNHTDFFPDKIISFGLWTLSGHSYDLFLIFYAIVGYTSWILASRFLFGSFLVGALSSAFMLALLCFGVGSTLLISPFVPTLHFTAFCLAMSLSVCFLRDNVRPSVKALCGGLLFLVFMSDRLIVVYVFAFLASAISIEFILRGRSNRFHRPVGALTIAAVIGFLFHQVLWNLIARVSDVPGWNIGDIVKNHVGQTRSWILAVITLAIWIKREPLKAKMRSAPEYELFYIILLFGVVSACLVAPKAILESRYLTPTAVLLIAAATSLVLKRQLILNLVTFSLPLVAIIAFASNRPADGSWTFQTPANPLASCLQEVNREHPLKSGVANYWSTHAANLFGTAATPLRAFWPDLRPHIWVNSIAYYKDEFNFIVSRGPSEIDLTVAENLLGSDFLTKHHCAEADTDIYVLSPAQSQKLKEHLQHAQY